MLRQYSWDMKVWAGQPGQEAGEDKQDGTGRTRKRGQDGQNMTE
jgi:hypothetical protein